MLTGIPVAQIVKNLPVRQETRVQPLGWEVPLGKGVAIHSSILAWRIPQSSLAGYSLWGRKESATAEQLTQSLLEVSQEETNTVYYLLVESKIQHKRAYL